MPGPGSWVPTIGVPFQAIRLSNGDGTSITVTVTVGDGAGRFATVINNTSVRSTRIVYYDPAPAAVTVPAGVTSIPSSGARRWPLSMSFSSA